MLWLSVFVSCDRERLNSDPGRATKEGSGRVIEAQESTARVAPLPNVKPVENSEIRSRIESLKAKLPDLPFGDQYRQVLTELAKALADVDPEAGKAWLLSLEHSFENLPAFTSFAYRYANTNAEDACEFAKTIPHESFRHGFLRGTLLAVTLTDWEKALSMLQTHKAAVARPDRLELEVLSSIAGTDPRAGWQCMSTMLARPGAGEAPIMEFFRSARFPNAENAFAFLDQIPNPEQQAKAVSHLVRNTPEARIPEIAQALATRPANAARDAGVEAMVDRIYTSNPQDSAEWALTIADSRRREQVIKKILAFTDANDAEISARVRALTSKAQNRE